MNCWSIFVDNPIQYLHFTLFWMHEKTLSDLLQPDSKYVSYMKDDILMIKRLFHFHGNEEDMKQLQCQYEKYVIESSNSPHFFARLIDLFILPVKKDFFLWFNILLIKVQNRIKKQREAFQFIVLQLLDLCH